jgi:hypothetical protein
VVTNGPLLELDVNSQRPGALISWEGAEETLRGNASVVFHRPIEKLEIIVNGEIVAVGVGNTQRTEISLPFEVPIRESAWIAARAKATSLQDEPEIWAHTNPVYALKQGQPVYVEAARKAVRERWAKEAQFYRNSSLVFAEPSQRREFLRLVQETETILEKPQPPWP